MPFKSLAQSKYFFAQAADKKKGIDPKMAKEWASKTDYSKLPEKKIK